MSSLFNYAERALRLKTAVCAFLLFSCLSLADTLLICSECGREGKPDQTACASCGAGFAAALPPKVEEPSLKAVEAKATEVMKAVAADVAEARRVSVENGPLAIVIYRNAQALLAAESGENFPARASQLLAEELKRTLDGFYESTAPSRRGAALRKARRESEDFFRSIGRTPFGTVWVPLDWQQTLTPVSLAAVRHALPLKCVKCDGSAVESCNKCGGSGRVKCRNSQCKNGFVVRRNPNSLTPETDIVMRDKCPVCKGSAHSICAACAGKGTKTCKKCDGMGEPPMCKSCQGSGLEACHICTKNLSRGQSKEVCRFCKGTLRILCRKCGGDGKDVK